MITLNNIDKVYRTERVETLALQNINLDIADGEFVSIMGPSGCGKSTLLNLIGLLDKPTKGKLLLDGMHINGAGDRSLAKMRNEKLGFVFQSFHLVPDLTVLDNVEIPLLYRAIAGKERRRMALGALDRVGLSSRVHHFPTQLSGGQQQRVAVARALVGRPQLLLADEPTGNLDSASARQIIELLARINAEEGMTIIMVTHDHEFAARAHRKLHILDGKLIDPNSSASVAG